MSEAYPHLSNRQIQMIERDPEAYHAFTDYKPEGINCVCRVCNIHFYTEVKRGVCSIECLREEGK